MAARGRPKKGEERPTTLVRVPSNFVELLNWVGRVEGKRTAQLIDEMIGEALTAKYAEIKKYVEQIKRAEDAARKARGLNGTPSAASAA